MESAVLPAFICRSTLALPSFSRRASMASCSSRADSASAAASSAASFRANADLANFLSAFFSFFSSDLTCMPNSAACDARSPRVQVHRCGIGCAWAASLVRARGREEQGGSAHPSAPP